MNLVTLEDVKKDQTIQTYINLGNDYLAALGYTDHGLRHMPPLCLLLQRMSSRLHFPEREQELAGIGGYLHDIGNGF